MASLLIQSLLFLLLVCYILQVIAIIVIQITNFKNYNAFLMLGHTYLKIVMIHFLWVLNVKKISVKKKKKKKKKEYLFCMFKKKPYKYPV